MIALVVAQKYKTLKTQGNHNNEIGMPQTLFGLDAVMRRLLSKWVCHIRARYPRMSMSCQPDVADYNQHWHFTY